jgi:hypothetical protein
MSEARGISGQRDRKEEARAAREEGKLLRRRLILLTELASPEERIRMAEPIGWRPEMPAIDLRRQIRYLQAHLDSRGGGSGIPPM